MVFQRTNGGGRKMSYQEILDECVREAITLGRKYMDIAPNKYKHEPIEGIKPTKEEWALALILFQEKIK